MIRKDRIGKWQIYLYTETYKSVSQQQKNLRLRVIISVLNFHDLRSILVLVFFVKLTPGIPKTILMNILVHANGKDIKYIYSFSVSLIFLRKILK